LKFVQLKLRSLRINKTDVVNAHHHVVANVDRFSIQLEHVIRSCNNIQLIAPRLECKKRFDIGLRIKSDRLGGVTGSVVEYVNLDILKVMSSIFSMSKSLYEASTNMVRQSGLGDNTSFAIVVAGGGGVQAIDGPSAPGTPIQATPEYVLNPLAIYRLARKAVAEKEKHAPELIASPEAHVAASEAASASSWGHANVGPHINQTQSVSSMFNTDGFHYNSTPQSAPASGSDVGDLQMFFSSDFDTIWQPAETILETSQLGGIAPWESDSSVRAGFEANEFDVFMPNFAWPLPDV
jgi:hypothetical protein